MTGPHPPFGITVCGIPDLDGHIGTGATHVLSILDPDRAVPEAFGSFGEHEKLELRFDDVIAELPGKRAPQPADIDAILEFGRTLSREAPGRAHLLVHCHAGISRSTASMVLILAQALPDQPADAIVAMVHAIREKAWPNLRMMEIGDAKLGRGGTLVAAVHALHGLQLDRRPHLAELMTRDGRGQEVLSATRLPPG